MKGTGRPALGILVLEGKMADVPGCMVCEATFPYPVVRKVVKGSKTPMSAEEARAMLPLYVEAAKELEQEGVGVITANCGLIALMQKELAAAVRTPVVTSGLLMVPLVHRMLPEHRVGILTFFTHAVSERNYRASGWSSEEIPVALGGVGESEAWNEFLRTKEIDEDLRERLEIDLLELTRDMLGKYPDIGAFVSECTMLPAVLEVVREEVGKPVYDILNLLDVAMGGSWRPADTRNPAAAVH